jgi:hypothetical protein
LDFFKILHKWSIWYKLSNYLLTRKKGIYDKYLVYIMKNENIGIVESIYTNLSSSHVLSTAFVRTRWHLSNFTCFHFNTHSFSFSFSLLHVAHTTHHFLLKNKTRSANKLGFFFKFVWVTNNNWICIPWSQTKYLLFTSYSFSCTLY